jgi:hypothetical protein
VVRVWQDGDVCLALLANGYDCGFATCWPPGSRLLLDAFEEAWAASSGGLAERLANAFERACARFVAEAPGLVPEDADFPDDRPTAILLAVATSERTAHALWIGGDVAVLARGCAVAAETTPHTMLDRFRQEHPEVTEGLDQIPNILIRTIGGLDQDAPSAATFDLAAGDALVLVSRAALRGPSVPTNDAAFAAAAYTAPAIVAERLAELAVASGDSPYGAMAVLRYDAVDVAAEIERLIDRYEPDPEHGAWLGDWVRSQRALPVSLDMGRVLGLTSDGSVLGIAWDEPGDSTRAETSAAAHLAAAVGAARRYPTLQTLAPRRPATASACSHCQSLATPKEAAPGCPSCLYLGWEPPRPPAWFQQSFAETASWSPTS